MALTVLFFAGVVFEERPLRVHILPHAEGGYFAPGGTQDAINRRELVVTERINLEGSRNVVSLIPVTLCDVN